MQICEFNSFTSWFVNCHSANIATIIVAIGASYIVTKLIAKAYGIKF